MRFLFQKADNRRPQKSPLSCVALMYFLLTWRRSRLPVKLRNDTRASRERHLLTQLYGRESLNDESEQDPLSSRREALESGLEFEFL